MQLKKSAKKSKYAETATEQSVWWQKQHSTPVVLVGHLESREPDESANEQYSGTDTGSDIELERGRCRDGDCANVRRWASSN